MSNSQEEKWKLYEANERCTNKLIETQQKTDAFADKWLITLAAGSFGLSFIFIESLVPLEKAVSKPLLIAAWGCFAVVLALQLAGFIISSIRFTLLAAEADKGLLLMYEGKEPDYKRGGREIPRPVPPQIPVQTPKTPPSGPSSEP
ncbi:MAG: hypothetical protein LBE02_02850 [Spirochaetaceae bacterium]|jgi:hypothetical protein|nr:hypothetical protein [Spirochaetaceae bacterium]